MIAAVSVEAGGKFLAGAKMPWDGSQWLEASDSKVAGEYEVNRQITAEGTSWFVGEVENEGDVKSATWMTTGLGVYEIYVNGKTVGDEVLKPGYTHVKKTRRSFTYDVTEMIDCKKGAKNKFAAEVSSGWWRDKLANYHGKKSAFRGVLQIVYTDGTMKRYCTDTQTWKACVGGKVTRAGIYDGEIYDARAALPIDDASALKTAVENTEFNGGILPSDGAEVYRRNDLAFSPIEAYCWKGVTGANDKKDKERVYGKVVKTRTFKSGEDMALAPGETLVIDFGQNLAGVPEFEMSAKRGTELTCLPGEMLNDRNGERSRGNDGPGGSVYRENMRIPWTAMKLKYTFAGDGVEAYSPRFTFFGYRYVSITATDAVSFKSVKSVPVTSITKEMELGRIETGDKDVNQLVSNIYWGQLSNYLSVPTDCPQRCERLGWSADTQIFAEAGTFNADTRKFLSKWMGDMRDSRSKDGGFTSVAPNTHEYGWEPFNFGWADAGVIVPWTVWKQFGDRKILEENWEAMARFVRKVDENKYKFINYWYADWLSFEPYETWSSTWGTRQWQKWLENPGYVNYRGFLAASYWCYDAQLMVQMAKALGKTAEAEEFAASEKRARDYIRATYLEEDGLLLKSMRDLQTACIFALKMGIVEGRAFDETKAILLKNIKNHGDCLQTGFLGTGLIMDTLTQIGAADVAYDLLLQHKFPSWLYSVDQGATTVWERWNSYRKDAGFGPASMNSFNHYAYGVVLAWMYKTAAGIEACPCDPGFKTIVMKPQPDRRLGYVKAEYKTPNGLVKSAWRYEGDKWIWDFTVPVGSKAMVTLPGATALKTYNSGAYRIER